MATIKEIAKLAEVSQATVSRVLSQDDTLVVSQEVKMKIFKIAHELKYVPPKKRHAKKNDKMIFGIADWHIVHQERSNVGIDYLNCLAKTMSLKVEVEFVRVSKNQVGRFDGIIALGVFDEEEIQQLQMQTMALVLINSKEQDYRYDSIIMDFAKGIQDTVEYLIEKREYRSIGYIGGVYQEGNVRIGYRRLESVRENLRHYNCLDENSIHLGEITKESGYKLTKKVIDSGSIPEVLLLGGEAIAEGAVQAIREAGLRIPKDVAVVIYEDVKTTETKWSEYTRVCMYPEIVWETAVKLLLEQILDGRMDNMKIFLPGKLEIGEST